MTTTQEPNVANDLTERQADVLRLHQEGKSPTEIGAELGVTSQGVHGHLRRLRQKGLIEPLPGAKPAPARASRATAPEAFDPQDTIRVVVQTITAQLNELNTREEHVDAEIKRLQAEKKAIAKAREELAALVPPGTSI